MNDHLPHATDAEMQRIAEEYSQRTYYPLDTPDTPEQRRAYYAKRTPEEMLKIIGALNRAKHALTQSDLFPPSAPALLDKAKQHMTERANQYDKPEGERSMGRAVQAFNAITGRELTEPEGWLLLQVLKDVRLFQRDGYHADSAEDCIAYAALKAEAKART